MKINVYSQFLFDKEMKALGLNDDNVENENAAFISIIGTKECLEYYLDEGKTKHYFNDNHNNVLKTIDMEQAEKAVDFIENMINNDVASINIHCRAGYSRSRAFAEFIYRYCKEHNIEVEYDDRNDYTSFINQGVLRKLNNAYWKKHKINGYENGEEYDDELINIPIIEIDSNE